MSLRVSVTQDDIDQGRPSTTESCPLALAITRTTDQLATVFLDRWDGPEIYVGPRRERAGYNHTKKSRKFVLDFDNGRTVTPSTFLLPNWEVQSD